MFIIPRLTRFFLLLLMCCSGYTAFAQTSASLQEGRGTSACAACQAVLDQLPREVLFGIHLSAEGDIIFVTNSISWFRKIFSSPSMGITVDLISRSRYSCDKPPVQNGATNGFVLKPMYRDELIKRADTVSGQIQISLGKVPAHLRKETLEGNFVIVNNTSVCRYTPVVDIDRGVLDLLPMGLYTDTLLQQDLGANTDTSALILYSVKKTITIPFGKGTADFRPEDLRRLRDSLGAGHFTLRNLELRAYSSVDGPEAVNRQLMEKRAAATQKAIASIAPGTYPATIIPAENWIEFVRDAVPKMPQFAGMTKSAIKDQLKDKTILSQLEPVLASHRKVVITAWLDKSTRVAELANEALVPAFNQSVKGKNMMYSRGILKEIAIRISENRLPDDYINKLEVPVAMEYQELASDKAVYQFYLGQTLETEALATLYSLRKNKPEDPFLNYNICVLELVALKYDTEAKIDPAALETAIRKLPGQGIHPSLVGRMMINYYIVQCERYMQQENFFAKDKAVEYISSAFERLPMNDRERYSLAKFFTAYGRNDLAMDIIRPRVNQLDAEEDVIFYFINLSFFNSLYFESNDFANAVLNAANLNRARFCRFFQPAETGGASMQLLESATLRKYHCDNCMQ